MLADLPDRRETVAQQPAQFVEQPRREHALVLRVLAQFRKVTGGVGNGCHRASS